MTLAYVIAAVCFLVAIRLIRRNFRRNRSPLPDNVYSLDLWRAVIERQRSLNEAERGRG